MWTDAINSAKDLLLAITGLLTAASGIGYAIFRLLKPTPEQEQNTPKVEVGDFVPTPASFDFQKAWERNEEEIDELKDKIDRILSEKHRLELILTRNNIDF